MRIELVIDELILHGFDPRHRHAIGDAVQEELTRILSKRWRAGDWSDPMTLATLDAGAVRVTAGRTAAHLGRDVANAVAAVLPAPKPRGDA